MPESDPNLVQIVEAQGRLGVGIPVLLFTDATLDATEPVAVRNVVQQAAHDLGYELDEIDLFSTASYLLQNAAGGLYVDADA